MDLFSLALYILLLEFHNHMNVMTRWLGQVSHTWEYTLLVVMFFIKLSAHSLEL